MHDSSPVLTVEEAAALLRVDRKTMYEAVRRHEVPGVVRVGRAIRIGRAAFDSWLAAGFSCARKDP